MTRRICLEPRFLDADYEAHLLRKVCRVTKNECTQEHGHILNVESKSLRIIDHKIGRAHADNIFTVNFQATALKPVVDAEVSGTVVAVIRDGIFVNLIKDEQGNERQKIWIPKLELAGWALETDDDGNSVYRSSEGAGEICIGDALTAKVTAVDYSRKKDTFSCIGSLKGLQSPKKCLT